MSLPASPHVPALAGHPFVADLPSAGRIWVVIPCAGTGTRAGGTGPKQYRLLVGRPLVLHTVAAFAGVGRVAGGVLVVAADDRFFEGAQDLGMPFRAVHCGGATRAESVARGLRALAREGATEGDWVLVHDAARCLVTTDQIDRLIDGCAHDAVGGLLAQPLSDTLKSAEAGRVATTIDRTGKWLAQTPQMFRLGLLAQALEKAGSGITDESSAIEALGLQPLLVMGSALNFKVTWPEDFALAEAVLASRQPVGARAPAADLLPHHSKN